MRGDVKRVKDLTPHISPQKSGWIGDQGEFRGVGYGK